jgi:hypothetical protein
VHAAEAEVELSYKVLTPELLELRTLAISRFWPLVGLLALATGSMGAAFLQVPPFSILFFEHLKSAGFFFPSPIAPHSSRHCSTPEGSSIFDHKYFRP